MNNDFLYQKTRYRGVSTPENIEFDAVLQSFTQQVNYIVGLETNGKISSVEAFERLQFLWEKLDSSKKRLRIGKPATTDNQQDNK